VYRYSVSVDLLSVAPPADTIWTRPAPREQRSTLTREAIVATAVALADADGLDAVTIRAVAGALKARPMSLYAHVGKKDDLLDLMLDAAVADALLDEVPSDWRAALVALAEGSRAAALRHPWIAAAVARRPNVGPNGMRHIEQSLAAIAALDLEPARARAILRAVDTYTFGNVAVQLADLPEVEDSVWRDAPNDDEDVLFRTGLDWLLDGFAASLGR